MDTRGYSHDMQIHVFVCIRYKWICTACIWYVSYTAGVYAVHICMYHDTICAQMTSAHICIYPSMFWWPWTHCSMITAMDTLQAIKQVGQTHGFETLYCFNTPQQGSQLAISWPTSWCSTALAGCPARQPQKVALPTGTGKAGILVTGHASAPIHCWE